MSLDTVNATQDMPKKGKQTVLLAVLKDFVERGEGGEGKYGVLLQTENGRDPLIDLYQEMMDGVMYLRQHLMERKNADHTAAIDPNHIIISRLDASVLLYPFALTIEESRLLAPTRPEDRSAIRQRLLEFLSSPV